ncbi:CAP domain-containing protein [Arachnia propionica]|jgi:SCP-like extracellular|uniref:CAP domain-containing protein n=1 Tax=Arachnia propionica TaxID=1750 RepID=A0AB37HVS3_9ACTN|nr:CAP domain-containing protein [Arachnia propionica]AFN47192.1 cysteine-rich secretory family protein [Arachnia propionica F0230a]QCT38751.1 CAP domain-containing protein [Arachnia propionica]QUC11640.1 CAP domain-containing protein [Arachnia propionica]RPA18470.1 CAP domain-containing protein [Arachnia propionica]
MKMVRLLLVALLAAAVSLIVPTAHAETGQQRPAVLPADVSEKGTEHTRTILNKVNNLRASLGLKPVTRIAELDAVAQDWSEQMAARKTMEHRPNFANHYPQGWRGASENIAMRSDGGDIGAQLFDQWLNSPPHYANMTDPNADSLGIGIAYESGSGNWYATQNFGSYGDPIGRGLTESGRGKRSGSSETGKNTRSATPTATKSESSGKKKTSRSGERKQSEKTESATPTQTTETPEATETPSEKVTPTPTQVASTPETTPTPSTPPSSAAPVAATTSDGPASPIILMGAGAIVMVGGAAATAIVRRVRLHG